MTLDAVLSEPVPLGRAERPAVPARRPAFAPRGLLAAATLIGEVVLAVGSLRPGRAHRSTLRWVDVWAQLDAVGARSVPIVMLVSALVGLILAYMGAAQLRLLGAQAYIADLVGVGMVREVAALMTGVILAGRVGAAFAAQIGAMKANEEIDALRVLGISPVEHLVLPRVLAMLVAAPPLTALAGVAGVVAGGAVALSVFSISPLEYATRTQDAITITHLLVGLSKGTVYALIVALAGCFHGLSAGRSAEAVGRATTTAVVHAVVGLVVAASVMTIALDRLGI